MGHAHSAPGSPPRPLAGAAGSGRSRASGSPEARAGESPRLRVTPVVGGLDHPWDVKRLPGGTLLISERDRATLSAYADGTLQPVAFPSDRIWVSGETGLMSLEMDPRFADNRRFYTCSGWEKSGDRHDIRVNAWTLSDDSATATLVGPLVKGLPTTTGRHGGCRLLIARDGSLSSGPATPRSAATRAT